LHCAHAGFADSVVVKSTILKDSEEILIDDYPELHGYGVRILNKDHCLIEKVINPTCGGYWPICIAVMREK
jgi:hypothetical protein